MNIRLRARWLLLAAMLVTAVAYWPGLSGSWLFDDNPNIVDNPGVQPHEVSVPALVRAALSSPASEFKRPLASLSFATNYLASGLDPFGWKLTNLVIHLLNGWLVFLLTRRLLIYGKVSTTFPAESPPKPLPETDTVATLIAAGWMLLPINLTAVLYVVQREESMANLFVLLGLIGYMTGRQRMLRARDWNGFWLCAASITLPVAIGLLAKETAVMLPLYAFLIEWIIFRFRTPTGVRERRLYVLFTAVLLLPMLAGLAWQLAAVLHKSYWATRNFTLGQRLLTETRVVCDYIAWTLLPTPDALSFYHDQFRISTGLLSPWTTLASLLILAALVVAMMRLRRHYPLPALGIALFLGCQSLTGTILPLELVYEHRNYFASLGLLLAVVPWLTAIPSPSSGAQRPAWLLPRRMLLGCLLVWWGSLTAITAYVWGDPLRLAQDLAARAPDSPRAEYELGRTYIIDSRYDPASLFTQLAYAPLEKAASFPESSILPQQALIFMNSRMGLPLKAAWWDSLIAKLRARKPGVQDESSLAALTQCARDGSCPLPPDRMVQAFEAALDHPGPSARLQATYGDYAWNVLGNHALGGSMMADAVKTSPNEPAYRITLARMAAAQGRYADVREQIQALRALDIGGRLDRDIAGLQALVPADSKE
ncbi:hypothetical protein [Rhodanobacter sp. DHG33]|uniref:hypothetical protein n=1 Tax=Rhodanobacter sp. DHG33 TaxID=2775921 RepID=UPI0017832B5D|nr:hypothetical protein [Rhodanobacter sp. DHG33]MBD8899284.1 hypothetical protein [Rhodanobacter sp. DHG33]